MTNRITELRKNLQRTRASFQGEPLVRAIFTGTARKGYTASDLEALETVSIRGQDDDGSFLPLPGYDDIPSYP